MEGMGLIRWDNHTEFLPFIQGLPNLVYLGLGGSWVPTVSTPQPRFEHRNLRHLWLKGLVRKVFQFLEFVPLQTLETLEIHAIGCPRFSQNIPPDVFRDFLEGRDEALQSLSLSSNPPNYVLEIGNPDHQTESGSVTPIFKLTVTGFDEAPPEVWGELVRALPPLESVEEVVLYHVQLYSSDAEHLLQLVPHMDRVIATGSDTRFIIRASQPMEVGASGE